MAEEQELPAYPIRAYQLIPDPNQPTVVALAIETDQGHSLFLATREILEDLGKDLLERAAKMPIKARPKIVPVRRGRDETEKAIDLSHNRSNADLRSRGRPHRVLSGTQTFLTKATAVTDAIDFLKTRRSVKPREMTGPGPSPAELDTILTIGARVPDHGKLAPWRFIIFEGDARVRAGEVIAKVFARKNPNASPAEIDVEKRRLTDAPLVIGVVSFTRPHPKVPPWEQELSAGASAMNIVTAATALGYGACWLTGWFAFDRDVLEGLGLKADEKLAGFIHIGTPAKPSEDRPRPALSDIVTRF